MNGQNRIVIDPAICHGKPVIRGVRMPVTLVVGSLRNPAAWKQTGPPRLALTRPLASLSHRMGEGRGEGRASIQRRSFSQRGASGSPSLARRMSFDEIQREYDLTADNIRAALKSVGQLAKAESFHLIPA